MNDSNTSGVLDQTTGKFKQAIGEATNDQSLANEGAADQIKGHAKEAWGNVKDTASELKHSRQAEEASLRAQEHAHNLRESITGAAEHTKDSINRGLDHLTRKANE